MLAAALQDLAASDDAYWSFADRGNRDYLHSLFRYPAMMVPRLQRELLETCVGWDPSIATVYDPFVGSGTVMTEAMLLGKSFVGTDINPLAILMCRAKSEYLDGPALGRDLQRLRERLHCDQSTVVDVDFPHMTKWFEPHVLEGLCKLRRAILDRPFARTRRVWWIILAETVRLVSNSRTSTVKLHLRSADEIASRPDPVARFLEIADRSVGVVKAMQKALKDGGLLNGAHYSKQTRLEVADVRGLSLGDPSDLLMSSPPYGDNHTTVTYGQASYLPLQWVRPDDVGPGFSSQLVANTHATDSASLGGAVSKRSVMMAERALDRSATLRRCLDELRSAPEDRRNRVAAFYRDFDLALDSILDNLKPGALMIWTVGDRSVGGQRIPLDLVLSQLIGTRATYVTDLKRSIPLDRKRMPTRNSVTATMDSETILVLRKSLNGST